MPDEGVVIFDQLSPQFYRIGLRHLAVPYTSPDSYIPEISQLVEVANCRFMTRQGRTLAGIGGP
jgi:hypothetical protein